MDQIKKGLTHVAGGIAEGGCIVKRAIWEVDCSVCGMHMKGGNGVTRVNWIVDEGKHPYLCEVCAEKAISEGKATKHIIDEEAINLSVDFSLLY